jgi:hypothetical protein
MVLDRFSPFLTGEVVEGKLVFDDPEKLSLAISNFEGKKVQVTINRVAKKRSKNENSYYWGVVIAKLVKEFGDTPDEVHKGLKEKFLRKEAKILGEEVTITESTTELSTVEFEEYLSQIRMWASLEWNIVIPLPHEGSWE